MSAPDFSWTSPAGFARAVAYFNTLPGTEVRRRQSLCAQQIARAVALANDQALANLQAMADALMTSMLQRTPEFSTSKEEEARS